MAESGAIFGGEHSGHFYFKDFWRADSGMLAALHAIAALLDNNLSLSELLQPFNRYAISGEINTKVNDQQLAIEKIKDFYRKINEPVDFDVLDGLTVTGKTWWFNLRPSNTEPLLRLNVEADTDTQMARLKDEVLEQLITQ
jgi:phosphomannomutase